MGEFEVVDTRGMRGISAGFAGICPSCGDTVFALSGEPDAVAEAMVTLEHAMESEGKIGMQSRDGKHIPFVE
ncbi:hypothetical protein [Trinickia mobilis]|uniref:hypothetical protein n=1 Tax=Trinickia mobilis TaxID=2816356 RepID=UPI001F5C7B91|nr:hypothetical protein [Trinickia mobilis]